MWSAAWANKAPFLTTNPAARGCGAEGHRASNAALPVVFSNIALARSQEGSDGQTTGPIHPANASPFFIDISISALDAVS